jgi:cytoskeleton protein RodZ
MASLAPFPSLPASNAGDAALPAGAHRLHLKLSEASWVEISADDGRKLEFGILPAGAERDYAANGPLSVRLGNTSGASVVLDGKPVDLAPYRRSNVAYFRVFGAKGAIAPVEN